MVAWGRRLRRELRHEPLPRRPLVVIAAAVAVGCVAGPAVAALAPPGTAARVTGGLWIVSTVLFCAWAWLARTARPGWGAGVLLVAIVATAAGWAVACERLFRADDLAWSLGETPAPVAIEGVVLESPRRLSPAGEDGPRLQPSSECIVGVTAVRRGAAWKSASGRAAVIVTGAPPQIVAGSRVRILGRGLRPGPALNPGECDFRRRAQARRCLAIVRCQSGDCIRVLTPPPLWSPAAMLERVRSAGVTALEKHVGERAGLAAALLLGSREALSADESQGFLVTGTIHILSISGLHVGILAIGLFRLLRVAALPRPRALLAVTVGTGLYMLLVGAETPVVRATLVVWLSCLGAAVGRRSPALNALAAAAIVVLAWHPPEIFRVGTQLSFLSTAVLVAASALCPPPHATEDPIERLVERSRGPLERRWRRLGRQVVGALITGGAIWAVTAPIVAAWFHVVSPIGLVLNPVIAPLVPLAMACGVLCLLLAPVSAWLAGACGAACNATLALVELVVGCAARIPWAYRWIAGPPAWWVVGAYALLLALLVTLPRERLGRLKTWVIAASAWFAVGLVTAAVGHRFGPQRPPLEVTAAALGHGCGIVVRSPSGRVLVYDAGRLGAPGAARRGMSAVLWSGGVSRIDTLVISHADADHFNAVPDLLERFAIGEVVVSAAFLRSDSEAVEDLLRRLSDRRVPMLRVGAGDEIPFDAGCRVRVLHCDASSLHDNQTSLVLAVEAAGRRLLLTGDLEGESLARFMERDPDSCDVLMAPHHGSATSLPPDIACETRPDWVVVSGPGGSRWEDVRSAYATARGAGCPAAVVKTSGLDGGAVRISFSAGGVTVSQFSAGRWRRVEAAVTPPSRPSPAASAMPRRPEERSSG